MIPSAKDVVLARYPQAKPTRSTFGIAIVSDSMHSTKLGDGRAYWEEEAWIAAAEMLERPISGPVRLPVQ